MLHGICNTRIYVSLRAAFGVCRQSGALYRHSRRTSTSPLAFPAETPQDRSTGERLESYAENQAQIRIQRLSELLNCSLSCATGAVMRNKKIMTVKEENLVKSVGILRILFSPKDILDNPEILTFQFGTVEQRYHALEEFGVKNVTIGRVLRYKELVSRPAYTIKRHRLIPSDMDPALQLLSHLDCPKEIQTEILSSLPLHHTVSVSLYEVKRIVLRGYLCWRLQCSQEELRELLRKYPSVQNRSLQFVRRTLDIFAEDFQFPTTKILRNGFLLLCHPGHLEAILSQVVHLGGMEVRRMGALCPRLLTVAPEQLLRIESVLQEHGITSLQIQRCPAIYTLGADTVEARLKELDRVSEFAVRKDLPRVLNLVYHCSKAVQRIQLLAERERTAPACPVTINALSAASRNFARVLYSGGDMRHGREAHAFLARHLDRDEDEVRRRLQRHPAAYRAALLNVRRVVELLEDNGIARDQLWEGLQVVLYDVELVAQHLSLLPTREELQPFDAWRSSRCLAELLLYYMERDTHFTGQTKMDVLHGLTHVQGSEPSAGRQEMFENLYLDSSVARAGKAKAKV